MAPPKLETDSLAALSLKYAKLVKPVKPVKRTKPPLTVLEKRERLERTLKLYSPVCEKLFVFVVCGSLMLITALMVVSLLVFCIWVAVYFLSRGWRWPWSG